MIFRDLDISNKYEIDFVAKVHMILGWKNSHNYNIDKLTDSNQWKPTLDFLKSKLQNSKIILAYSDSDIIGVQWAEIKENSDELNSHMIWVREEYRNTGVAKKLREKIFEWGIKQNAKYFISSTTVDNLSMQNHNLKLGLTFQYEELRGNKTYYVYRKKLKKSGSPVGGGVRS
ncbi:MAG: GNAT family N-acetyltransferase [Pelagibacterales bacterium]|nr:GNAT family N-acetyltransferase [Pelagibacterales bacterium]